MRDSARFDSQRTPTVSGAWYAPTGRHQAPDYMVADLSASGYRVTRRKQSANHTAQWEIECLKCEAKKSVSSTDIKGELAAPGSRVAACRCDALHEIQFRRDGVREQFHLNPTELRFLIQVMACEKSERRKPTRIEIERRFGAVPPLTALIRGGWIETEGMPMLVSSKPKAWRELGVTR